MVKIYNLFFHRFHRVYNDIVYLVFIHQSVSPLSLSVSLSHINSLSPVPQQIQWLDELLGVLHSGIEHLQEKMDDGKRVHAQATLTFTPTRQHHARTFICLTHNPALNTPLKAEVRLHVEYPPEIELVFTPGEGVCSAMVILIRQFYASCLAWRFIS